jgi:hypothetical protein
MVTSIGATAKRSKELKKAASCRRRKPPREAPFGACSRLPSPSSTRRHLCTNSARHRVRPQPFGRHLRAPGNLEQARATRPHLPPRRSEHRVYQRTGQRSEGIANRPTRRRPQKIEAVSIRGSANPAFLEGFPLSRLLSVAPYCVPGGVRVVSEARGYASTGERNQYRYRAEEDGHRSAD